jgi:hypothetical protein
VAPVFRDPGRWGRGNRHGSRALDAPSDHRERVHMVKEVIGKGAVEMAFSTRLETDYGLRWDHERQVWTTRDGFAYDGSEARDAA